MKLILDTTIDGIKTRVDGTINISLTTQELNPTQAANLFQLRGKYIKTLISDTNITKLEEEQVDNLSLVHVKKNKTESQRLRNVLYRYCEQMGQDFEQFYKAEMSKIIEHYKSKLE